MGTLTISRWVSLSAQTPPRELRKYARKKPMITTSSGAGTSDFFSLGICSQTISTASEISPITRAPRWISPVKILAICDRMPECPSDVTLGTMSWPSR